MEIGREARRRVRRTSSRSRRGGWADRRALSQTWVLSCPPSRGAVSFGQTTAEPSRVRSR